MDNSLKDPPGTALRPATRYPGELPAGSLLMIACHQLRGASQSHGL
jgi:hypothetical protein